ncbi:MAG: TonB family protein [Bradymonadia bacterium]
MKARLLAPLFVLLGATAAAAADPETPPGAAVPPVLQAFVPASYPPEAAAARIGASVLLRLEIELDGRVAGVEVVESAGAAFDQAATEAARQFVFTPARVAGEPTRVRILYRYAFVPPTPPPTTGELSGLVRLQGAATGLGGVVVRLGERASTTTDAEGRFSFDAVEPGEHRVVIEAPGRPQVQVAERVAAGERIDATYELEPPSASTETGAGEDDDLEIIVRAPAVRRQAQVTEVSAETARRLPGTQGDVVKVVDAMPGVGRASTGSGDVIVWGASADETRIYLDDVPLPRLYHDGGGRSVVGSDLVAGVELVPGGYGAAYGRGLGGLIRVQGLDLASTPERLHASASADVFDVAVGGHGPLPGGLRLGGTARLGHLDRVVSALVPPEDRGLIPAPRSRDLHLRLQAEVGAGGRLDLFALHSADATRRAVTDDDPDRTIDERRDSGFERLALRLNLPVSGGSRVTLTSFWGQDRNETRNAVGPVETFEARDARLGGLRAALQQRPLEGLDLEVGVDLELSTADLERGGAPTQPPREGDPRVFGQAPPVQVALDAWTVDQVGVAPFVTADLAPWGDVLHLEPGLRLDPNVRSVSRRDPAVGDTPEIGLNRQDLELEPRLAVRTKPFEGWQFSGAVGRFHQPAQDRDLSAVSGNPTLRPSRADHALVSVAATPSASVSAEVTAFGRWSDDLAVRAQTATPETARGLLAEGEGRVRGAQLNVKASSGTRWLGWLAYTWSRSERRSPGAAWRLSDLDQTHVLTAAGSFRPFEAVELGSRLRLSSGFPETPVERAYFDAQRDRWEPVFGDPASARGPYFLQWDLRVATTLDLPNPEVEGRVEVWLEVQNVLNRRNVETWVYDDDYAGREGLAGLPTLPFLGVRWSR